MNGTTERIYRLKNGKFEKYAQNRWQISDRYERAVQDPEFIEVDEQEANKLIGQQILSLELGTNPLSWPKHCLIPYPSDFDSQIDLLVQALGVASTNPSRSRAMVQTIDSESMKRWYRDVSSQSGIWRAKHSGKSSAAEKSQEKPQDITQEQLEDLFQRDEWRCRYCRIRIGGNREHFEKFANAIEMPELISGRTDETRHGVYLMLMASPDHVQPRSQGGSDDKSNLVTACWSCQFGKWIHSLDSLELADPRDIEPLEYEGWGGLNFK